MRHHPAVAAVFILGLLLGGCAASEMADPTPTLTPPATADAVPVGAAATYFSVACLSGDSIEAFEAVTAGAAPTADELVAAATLHEREMTVASEMLAAQQWPESLRPAAAELAGYFEGRIGLARGILDDPSRPLPDQAREEPEAITQARSAFSEQLGVPLDPPCH